ncbi:MAG TPA: hypothetical protein VK203_18020 [Nostocaceae cyanobacterium]|nr:hypothetical protein [Nostocaceae cyanobacterium]
MHNFTSLSKLPLEKLVLIANRLDIPTKRIANNQRVLIDAILRKQYQDLIGYFSGNLQQRQNFSTQLRSISAQLEVQFSARETQLIESQPVNDPIMATLQTEANKVNKAISHIREAVNLLEDCSVLTIN